MKNHLLPRLMLVAAFTAAATMAYAQAVPRGGGGGGGGSSSSGGGGGGGGGSTASSPSSGGGGSTYSAPAPSHSSAPPRTPSHSSGSSGSNSGSSAGSSGGYHGGSGSTAGVRRPDGGSTSAATAPTYARPDGTTGRYAIPRVRQPGYPSQPIYAYPPFYTLSPWGFGLFGYGYGLNYLYDPWSYGSPYGYGYGYPGYGYPGYGYGYGSGYGYYTGADDYTSSWQSLDQQNENAPKGNLRIKVKPREAKVIVDGAFMGTVDDFDGFFQKLSLPEGRHQVMLQLDGYDTLTFDIVIIAGQTVNYKGEMHKIGDTKH